MIDMAKKFIGQRYFVYDRKTDTWGVLLNEPEVKEWMSQYDIGIEMEED